MWWPYHSKQLWNCLAASLQVGDQPDIIDKYIINVGLMMHFDTVKSICNIII